MNEIKQASLRRRILAALLVLGIFAFTPAARSDTDPYLKISEGDSRARVIGLLGKPADPRKDLTAAEQKSIKETLKITDNKDAVDFVIWKQSSRLYYLVGFNKKDRVSTKHRIFMLAGGR